MAIRDMGLPMASTYPQVAIIGDDVEQDLGGGAIELGLRRYLVKTGKYQDNDENKATAPLAGVFASFPDVINQLLLSVDNISN
ncbi:hypothetical protein BDF22DRAFT_228219 [Syncephalis plumigaleata]|nr:hypothetical protein BDF22DRAFT_228219 [Syncephalis plumigaleata]